MKRSIFALALAAALPLSAQASELSYTYVEGDYSFLNSSVLNISTDADIIGVRGSYNFGASDFYGFGGYSNANFENTSFDVDQFDLGFGYHHALADNADLLAELAYERADAGSFNADGYRTSVGLRTSFSGQVEGLLKANYRNGDRISGTFSGTAGLLFKLNNTWALNGEVEVAEHDTQTYTVGIRASF